MTLVNPDERSLLRSLARRYLEICHRDVQNERRDLWRRHNSLERTRVPVHVRAYAWAEHPESACVCSDPFLRQFEDFFRRQIFRDSLGDDSIFEPWVTVGAAHRCSGWGLSGAHTRSATPGGSYKIDYPIKTLEDASRLQPPRHDIDEEETRRRVDRARDLLGDLITINLDRGPAYRVWSADLSTDLGRLRGIENFMLDMMDHPEWLHRLLAFMRDGVLRAQSQAEAAGDWGLANHENQIMPYAREFRDPAPNVFEVKRKDLWVFTAAQEFTLVSPAMHDEFLLQYQLPIMKEFGLVSYGCCEDLTRKIDMLRQIPNLRRIAVTPTADAAKCAEQIGTDYVISYRPSPSDMVGYGFDPDRIRRILRRDLEACRGCHVDVMLKDVETVQNDPTRVRHWVEITRRVIDELAFPA